MSSLLEFQHRLAEDKKATYSIETSELNPKKIKTDAIKETREQYEIDDYTLKSLRKYILKHSTTLASSGNIIEGKIGTKKVTLTVLKIKE